MRQPCKLHDCTNYSSHYDGCHYFTTAPTTQANYDEADITNRNPQQPLELNLLHRNPKMGFKVYTAIY